MPKPAYGFVLNRLQMALFREALHLARDGVALVADIDRTASDGLGLRWALLGPYGVEATYADGVRDDLEKFGDFMVSVWRELNTAAEPVSDEDIRLAVNGVAERWNGRSTEELAERRNRIVLRVRGVRAALPLEHRRCPNSPGHCVLARPRSWCSSRGGNREGVALRDRDSDSIALDGLDPQTCGGAGARQVR